MIRFRITKWVKVGPTITLKMDDGRLRVWRGDEEIEVRDAPKVSLRLNQCPKYFNWGKMRSIEND